MGIEWKDAVAGFYGGKSCFDWVQVCSLGIFQAVWREVLMICLRIGKDTWLEKQCMALGYGEIKDILMIGGFVHQYAYFLRPLGLLNDWLCFQ